MGIVNRALLALGKQIAVFWCLIASLTIIAIFPVLALLAAMFCGDWARHQMGGSTLVLWSIFAVVMAFLIGYVWFPFVKNPALEAAKEMLDFD